MSSDHNASPHRDQLADVQAALFSLRDGLMNLKMSLLELNCTTDSETQRQARSELDDLMARLRS